MKTKKDTQYAIIKDNKVFSIFNGNDIKEYDHKNIFVVEIPKDKDIQIGTKYDPLTQNFIHDDILTIRQKAMDYLNNITNIEISTLQKQFTMCLLEIDTWDMQVKEALELQQKKKADTPILTNIANERGIEVSELAKKVLSKHQEYSQNLGKLLGYKQQLQKAIEQATTKEQILQINYISPLSEDKDATK